MEHRGTPSYDEHQAGKHCLHRHTAKYKRKTERKTKKDREFRLKKPTSGGQGKPSRVLRHTEKDVLFQMEEGFLTFQVALDPMTSTKALSVF